MYCRTCGTQLDEKAVGCTKCGLHPLSGKKFCYHCGRETAEQAIMCVGCGVGLAGTSDKNRVTAGLFALLLGGLGVHKFYLGQAGLGVLYLVFCWTFIPSIIGAVEGIMYLTMSDQAFAAKYAK